MSVRLLMGHDESLLEEFLSSRRDSSMFLRSNVRCAGLVYRGEPFQAIYAAAFRDERVIGVAAHCWNGIVLVQAPEHTAEVAHACVTWSGRRVTGLSGPLAQVRRARSA